MTDNTFKIKPEVIDDIYYQLNANRPKETFQKIFEESLIKKSYLMGYETCKNKMSNSSTNESKMNNQEILNALNEKIKAAEEALLYLNQTKAGLERVIANSTKTPSEEAYKDWWGEYPTNTWQVDVDRWNAFQAGYNAAYKEPEDTVWKSVALRFGEKMSDVGPDGYYEFSPDEWFEWALNECFAIKLESEQEEGTWKYDPDAKFRKQEEVKKLQEEKWNYKITDEKGETNPYKQYLNSEKPPTLYDICEEWFDDDETPPVSDLVDRIEEWLPKEQSAKGSQNVYVELTVEGFNDAIKQIKSKLR